MLLERCVGRPASELAVYPPDQLLDLKKQAHDALARAKANAELVDRALDLRYSRVAAVHRVAAGKDAGTFSFNDGVVRIAWTNPILVDGANGVIAGHGRLAGQVGEADAFALRHAAQAVDEFVVGADHGGLRGRRWVTA